MDRLESPNFPLGFFGGIAFAVEKLQLGQGDLLLIFSDGVTEARDSEGELFGETRLMDLLGGCAREEPQEVCGRVMAEVRNYVGAAPQADDLTLTVLRFESGGSPAPRPESSLAAK